MVETELRSQLVNGCLPTLRHQGAPEAVNPQAAVIGRGGLFVDPLDGVMQRAILRASTPAQLLQRQGVLQVLRHQHHCTFDGPRMQHRGGSR